MGLDVPRKTTGLTSQQEAAINLLVTGNTIHDVSVALGLSRNTISNWTRLNPLFQEELKKRQEEARMVEGILE